MTQINRAQVIRFNKEVIAGGSLAAFQDLVSDEMVNHTARPGSSKGADGMIHFLFHLLRPALSDIEVTIHHQVAEGDLVATRKEISGLHTGSFMGIAPTGKKVTINVMDFIRLKNGQYVEHWGMSNISELVSELNAFHEKGQ